MRLHGLGEGQRRLQPLAQRQPRKTQARCHLFDPGAIPLAEARPGGLSVPLDPQPFGLAIQKHHPPRLPGAPVEEEPAGHGRRNPSPSSSIRVS